MKCLWWHGNDSQSFKSTTEFMHTTRDVQSAIFHAGEVIFFVGTISLFKNNIPRI